MGNGQFTRKIQTYVKGNVRKQFELDLIATGLTPSELAKDIISDHYKRKEEIQNQLKIAEIQKHSKSKYM